MEQRYNYAHCLLFENIQKELLSQIKHAKQSLKIAVTWFTDHTLFDALMAQIDNVPDLQVDLIVLNDRINNHPRGINFQRIITGNRGRFYFSSEEHLIHHKFCIIDDRVVITGSYNWTNKARINRENVIIIDDPTLAADYSKEFSKIIAGNLVENVEANRRLTEPFSADQFIAEDNRAAAMQLDRQVQDTLPSDLPGAPAIAQQLDSATSKRNEDVRSVSNPEFELGILLDGKFFPTISINSQGPSEFEGSISISHNDPSTCELILYRRDRRGVRIVEYIDLLKTKPDFGKINAFRLKMSWNRKTDSIHTTVERIGSNRLPRARNWLVSDYATRNGVQ